MKHALKNIFLLVLSLIIIFSTLVHGTLGDISVFHGLILHPLFLLIGLSLFAYLYEKRILRK